MANNRPIDTKAAMSILNSRDTLTSAHVGSQVILCIQGSPTFQSAADQEIKTPGQANYFDKHIYNLKANSQELMSRKENRKLFAEAVKLESAGDVDGATEAFNKYLNAVQVSFNQIADRGRKLESGDMVTAIVALSTTKTGHQAIVVNSVKYKAPVAVEKTKFDVTELFSDEDVATEEPVLTPAQIAAAKKAAAKAGAVK